MQLEMLIKLENIIEIIAKNKNDLHHTGQVVRKEESRAEQAAHNVKRKAQEANRGEKRRARHAGQEENHRGKQVRRKKKLKKRLLKGRSENAKIVVVCYFGEVKLQEVSGCHEACTGVESSGPRTHAVSVEDELYAAEQNNNEPNISIFASKGVSAKKEFETDNCRVENETAKGITESECSYHTGFYVKMLAETIAEEFSFA